MIGAPFRAFDQNVDRLVRRTTIVYSADDIRRAITLCVRERRPCNLELGDDIGVTSGFTIPGELISFSIDGGDRFRFLVKGNVPFLFKALGAALVDGGGNASVLNASIVLKANAVLTTAFVVDQLPQPLFQLRQTAFSVRSTTIEAAGATLVAVFGVGDGDGVSPQRFGVLDVDTLNIYGARRLFAEDGAFAGYGQSRFYGVTIFGPKTLKAEVGNGPADINIISSVFAGLFGKFNVSLGSLSDSVLWQLLQGGGGTFTTTGGSGYTHTLIRADGFTAKTLSAGTKDLDL